MGKIDFENGIKLSAQPRPRWKKYLKGDTLPTLKNEQGEKYQAKIGDVKNPPEPNGESWMVDVVIDGKAYVIFVMRSKNLEANVHGKPISFLDITVARKLAE